jgi:hypothetical protein
VSFDRHEHAGYEKEWMMSTEREGRRRQASANGRHEPAGAGPGAEGERVVRAASGSADVGASAGGTVQPFNGHPRLVERLLPGAYRRVDLELTRTRAVALAEAKTYASLSGRSVCLVLSPGDCIYVDPSGDERHSTKPPACAPSLSARLERSLLVEYPSTQLPQRADAIVHDDGSE